MRNMPKHTQANRDKKTADRDLVTLETIFPAMWHIIGQSVPFDCVSHCVTARQAEVNKQHVSVTSKTQDVCLLCALSVTAPSICLQVREVGGKYSLW